MAVVADVAPQAPGADGFFTKKLGPLPVWAWAAIGAGGAYLWWRHKQNTAGSSATSPAASTAADTNSFDYGPSIAAQQSEIQALQGEESTEDADARNPAPQGVSRNNRSPKVRRQIHTINNEHNAYEKRKAGTRPTSSAVKTSKPAAKQPAARTPARQPARRTTNRRAG